MPQLDQFAYFTQFFWSCYLFLTFYILICNDRDGVLGINKILKLRNQMLSHRGNNIQKISSSRGMESNIFYLISKSSYSNPGWVITCKNDIMLIHVLADNEI
ncbi:putative ATP synthase protein YMF19 [Bienertia sinuspersici]